MVESSIQHRTKKKGSNISEHRSCNRVKKGLGRVAPPPFFFYSIKAKRELLLIVVDSSNYRIC